MFVAAAVAVEVVTVAVAAAAAPTVLASRPAFASVTMVTFRHVETQLVRYSLASLGNRTIENETGGTDRDLHVTHVRGRAHRG